MMEYAYIGQQTSVGNIEKILCGYRAKRTTNVDGQGVCCRRKKKVSLLDVMPIGCTDLGQQAPTVRER